MIDFIKRPVDNLAPILNCNGHDWADSLVYITRIAQTFDANALMVNEARQDVRSGALEVVTSKVVGLSEGRLLKNGVSVVRIINLPVTETMMRRSKGEDAPDDPQRLETREKLKRELAALQERERLLQKILEMT